MFKKYASNILIDLSNECIIRSLSSNNPDEKDLYRKISNKIEMILFKLGVEQPL